MKETERKSRCNQKLEENTGLHIGYVLYLYYLPFDVVKVKLHGEKIIKADLESQVFIKPVPSAINTLHLLEPVIQPVREVVVDYTPDNVKVGYKESLELTIIHDCRGGSRWRTLMPHSFGLYKAKIRTPSGNASGLCSTLYLSTVGEQQDEIDCEFLGKEKGLLQTNFITGGTGGREVQYHLWMDTSVDFHEYSILWTPTKISWFLDERCLRVAEREGDEPWPVRSMYLYGSVWNAESVVDGEWAGTYVGCDEPYTCAYKDVFVPAGCDICEDAGRSD